MKFGKSLAQLDIEALALIRREPGCEHVFSVSAYRIDGQTFGLADLVGGQSDSPVAEQAMRKVEQYLQGRYSLIWRD